ncbi:MAG: NADH-quinone oxidoreductase subunit L, partial [Ancrocorticia populi]
MTLGLIPASVTAASGAIEATGPANLIWLCVAIPLLGAGILLLAGKAANAWGHWLGIATSTGAFVVAVAALFQVLGQPASERVLDTVVYRWVPAGDFSIDIAMRVDPLSLTFLMLVTFVGTLIHIYSVGYMKHDPDRRRFFAYLNFFVASMLLLVLGNSYLVLFIGWEGVGL